MRPAKLAERKLHGSGRAVFRLPGHPETAERRDKGEEEGSPQLRVEGCDRLAATLSLPGRNRRRNSDADLVANATNESELFRFAKTTVLRCLPEALGEFEREQEMVKVAVSQAMLPHEPRW